MYNGQSFRLEDIIPLDEMSKILRHFCEASKLITILSDFRGKMLTSEKNTSYYTSFCKHMRLTNCPLEELCMRSDAIGGLEAARRGEPYIYRCHMGFVEIAAPIVVNDMHLGMLLMGQVRTDPDKMEKIPQVFSSAAELESRPELKKKFEESFENAPVIPYEELMAFAGLMDCTANFIAQSAINQSMRDQLNTSRIKYLEEQNHKVALEKNLTFLHLKNLRMRAHPHFLFNTLNIINGLAVLEDAPRTSEAITAMADTLRSSLKNQEPLVTLREEMQCVKSYLLIQEFSLNGRVEFSCTVDENCLDALIPVFTIEMLVENTCVHGFTSVKSDGKFELDVRKIGDSIHINVKDNGSGIDSELADFLNNTKVDMLTAEADHGNGLRSLISSLHYHFGDEARWKFSRLRTGGTHAQIIIPARYAASAQPENPYKRA